MLIIKPKEMCDNPSCYIEKDGNYIPSESATEEEIKIIKEFNKKMHDLMDDII